MDNKMVDFSKFETLNNVHKDGNIRSNRKESAFFKSFVGVTYDEKTKTVKVIVDARFYSSRDKVHCCVWVRSEKNDFYVSGGGYADGWGYDKESASMADALENAGLPTKSLDGRGEFAIHSAITEIIEKLGYKNITVIDNHG